jgi:hypothetical protein
LIHIVPATDFGKSASHGSRRILSPGFAHSSYF